jgi:hypothetical protein
MSDQSSLGFNYGNGALIELCNSRRNVVFHINSPLHSYKLGVKNNLASSFFFFFFFFLKFLTGDNLASSEVRFSNIYGGNCLKIVHFYIVKKIRIN